MKLSKSLLSALVIGIATQTVATSCKKEKLTPEQKAEAAKKEAEKKLNPLYYCPGCGMG